MDFNTYIALDLETTGLEPSFEDITEIAMVKVESGKITDRFETFVYTPREINDLINYITGISNQDLKDAPEIDKLKDKIEEFIGDFPLLGHNIAFDYNFLKAKGVNLKEDHTLFDTYHASALLYPELPSQSLETNTKYFEIHHEDSHRAMADVIASHELWQKLINSFPQIPKQSEPLIEKIISKSTWPFAKFLIQSQAPSHITHDVNAGQTAVLSPINIEYNKDASQILLARGMNTVNIASQILNDKKTIFLAAYEHGREQLNQTISDSHVLYAPYQFYCQEKVNSLLQSESLTDGQTMILLKIALYPEHVTKNLLALTYAEYSEWNLIKADESCQSHTSCHFGRSHQESLNSQNVISSHYLAIKHPEFIEHFERIVILEPQLIESNATDIFGRALSLEEWKSHRSDEEWLAHGEELFAFIEELSLRFAPESQYTEKIPLTDPFKHDKVWTQIATKIISLVDHYQSDETTTKFLKPYSVFISPDYPELIRWIEVDRDKYVRWHVSPIEVSVLLNDRIWKDKQLVILSNTLDTFEFLHEELPVTHIKSEHPINTILPDLFKISGTEKEGDHKSQIQFITNQMSQLKGKSAFVFSSKAILKRYFLAIYRKIGKEHPFDLFAEDISGGRGKLHDRYVTSENQNKIIFITYRNLRMYPAEEMDFDNIVVHAIPFNPPGSPVEQARDKLTPGNSFIKRAVPAAAQNLLEICSNFTQRDVDKNLTLIDPRLQEKDYGKDILKYLE